MKQKEKESGGRKRRWEAQAAVRRSIFAAACVACACAVCNRLAVRVWEQPGAKAGNRVCVRKYATNNKMYAKVKPCVGCVV